MSDWLRAQEEIERLKARIAELEGRAVFQERPVLVQYLDPVPTDVVQVSS